MLTGARACKVWAQWVQWAVGGTSTEIASASTCVVARRRRVASRASNPSGKIPGFGRSRHGRGCGRRHVISVGAVSAGEKQATTDGDGEVSLPQAKQWLADWDLVPELAEGTELTEDHIRRRYLALSKCRFGTGVEEDAKRNFLRRLIPLEWRLAAK